MDGTLRLRVLRSESFLWHGEDLGPHTKSFTKRIREGFAKEVVGVFVSNM